MYEAQTNVYKYLPTARFKDNVKRPTILLEKRP